MNNKRRFPRRPTAESLSLTVVSADKLAEPGERIYCESVDISPVGLQVTLDRPLLKNSKVEIWMVLLGNRQTLHLHGRISWQGLPPEGNTGQYRIGIELLPVAESDFGRWLTLFDGD